MVIETSEAKFWGSDTQAETVAGLNEQQGDEEGPPASEKVQKVVTNASWVPCYCDFKRNLDSAKKS